MRTSVGSLLVLVIILVCHIPAAAAQTTANSAFDTAGTTADQVQAFLRTFQEAVAIGNRLRVATLVQFPLQASVDGRTITIRNESEFQARYSQIFDAALRRAIADAKIEALKATQQGVLLGDGRLCFRPVAARKNALKVVTIGETVRPQ